MKKPIYKNIWVQTLGVLFVFGIIGSALAPTETGGVTSSSSAIQSSSQPSAVSTDPLANIEEDNDLNAVADESASSTEDQIDIEPDSTIAATTTYSLLTSISNLEVFPEKQVGYDRDLFRLWTDEDGDGCDTRREVLISESLSKVSIGSGCSISNGTWISAYDLLTTTNPSDLDIDHLVPLKEAWESGAWQWNEATRQAFANDVNFSLSLIAVSASSNRSKSDRDPADWLPANKDYWCEYVSSWVQVKTRWNLSIDSAEKLKLETVGKDCAGETLEFAPKAETVNQETSPTPSSSASTTPTASATPTATASPTPTPAKTTVSGCAAGQVDINSASIEELKRIKYIDEVRAPLVVDLRPYKSLDGLIDVKGIGPVYLQRIKDEGIACVG